MYSNISLYVYFHVYFIAVPIIYSYKSGFVKVTTVFSYNRRCHSFSYSSSRLDPHSDYRRFLIGREKPLFHLYKNPVQCGKQRTPVSPESQPQYCKCARDGTAFCHNLSDAVRQRFAAYYPGRKTQRERSATTGSAGVMRILSCCSHNQPAEVEEKSFLPAFFYGIYSVANLVCFHIFRFSQNHSFISTNPG